MALPAPTAPQEDPSTPFTGKGPYCWIIHYSTACYRNDDYCCRRPFYKFALNASEQFCPERKQASNLALNASEHKSQLQLQTPVGYVRRARGAIRTNSAV